MSFLFDTNVLIYGLEKSRPSAVHLLIKLSLDEGATSTVSWIEMLVGAVDKPRTRRLLNQFRLVPLSRPVMERTVLLRQTTRLKLPDAIVHASALATGRTLVTYNTRDFPLGTPSVFCPEPE